MNVEEPMLMGGRMLLIYCDAWYSLMLRKEGSTQFVALLPGVNQLSVAYSDGKLGIQGPELGLD